MLLSLSFSVASRKQEYNYTFKHKLSFLVGDSAIGKSFIANATAGKCTLDGNSIQKPHIVSDISDVQFELQAVSKLPPDSVVIVEEDFIDMLIEAHVLYAFFRSACMLIVISRNIGCLGTVPISPQQYYTLKTDSSRLTVTIPAYPDWRVKETHTEFISEDSGSGNIIWQAVVGCRVTKAQGNANALAKLLRNSKYVGCIDTLSLSGNMIIFDRLFQCNDVPFFNVPSVEYLVLQALIPTDKIDARIYTTTNPEVACEKYLRMMAPEYSKSKTSTLLCAVGCQDCKQDSCRGKQVNVIQRMREYLKQLHPEYTFPWETLRHLGDHRTNLFKSTL